jgi:hypothetical protein
LAGGQSPTNTKYQTDLVGNADGYLKIPISVVLYWQRMELARSQCGQIKTTSWRLTLFPSATGKLM